MEATKPANMTASQYADAMEEKAMRELDITVATSALYTLGERDPTHPTRPPIKAVGDRNGRLLMGDDPRLPKMPEKPTLLDFFRLRWGHPSHLLQSAKHALKDGQPEKIVLCCLVHDIAVYGFIRPDHGYWGAQLLEPYIDEESVWAIRNHQALRFYADEAAGYAYPENYRRWFGDDYVPEPYIQEEYSRAREHKWYMTARLITVNDIYSFDPNVKVELEEFEDIIGRNFKQPKEGLGFDGSPVAHMWRTMIWPTKAL